MTESKPIISAEWDPCLTNLAIGTTVGFGVGALISFTIFRGRSAPTLLFTGIGLGQGYGQCAHLFREAKKVKN
ncbi:hypothetical protein CONCODRAFT_76684 [Conidiobolus coronatus NRRL 28638]|jgi:inner membrane organizing system protein 1|uniref:MICOS complex subunit MIC10 n=1 Tax=Conidiobolus coronatus (strain ATCC 28846 / CBS 209.66 / NRRL 28638) TaxID=796925 RepID=A0A137PIH7_CONC2|nr:hypothetical protein CONCODRAFT_76684 [Conidiobolus coronatus NRRL 28638]|eukprot:KXN74808.1 hypothetical protein CONCODRAFT_76684 [Conidiobolus coronatus NRRL 28638]